MRKNENDVGKAFDDLRAVVRRDVVLRWVPGHGWRFYAWIGTPPAHIGDAEPGKLMPLGTGPTLEAAVERARVFLNSELVKFKADSNEAVQPADSIFSR